jgi:hypothetical protein
MRNAAITQRNEAIPPELDPIANTPVPAKPGKFA